MNRIDYYNKTRYIYLFKVFFCVVLSSRTLGIMSSSALYLEAVCMAIRGSYALHYGFVCAAARTVSPKWSNDTPWGV